MSSRSILAIPHISFAVILITFLFAISAQAQVSVTFQGRVMYSTGTPAAGAQVTMTRTENCRLPTAGRRRIDCHRSQLQQYFASCGFVWPWLEQRV